MVSSSRQAIACILLIFGTTFYSQSQTNPVKQSTASISGKVTVKGKGVPGIVVIVTDPEYRRGWHKARHRATTDASGNYRISNLPEGTYRVTPHALTFVLENEQQASNTLIVGEGETIEDMNFALVRGGVITGKIIDSEGQPLIDEHVRLTPLDEQTTHIRLNHFGGIQTDDRGIYRAFGLRPGKYKVSAGQPSDDRLPGGPGRAYRQTFYPSTTDEAKAIVVEVSEGSEINNVDITMAGRTASGFKVTGRIIDGESGKPLPNVVYGLTHKYEGGSSSSSGSKSNANGEFKIENLSPGKYSVYLESLPNSGMRANPVSFEVTDHDVTGLTIKTVKGASLSGIIVLDGIDQRPLTMKPGELHIHAWVETSDPDDHHTSLPSLKPDGSFTISGLRGGTARISLSSANRSGSNFGIVRVERDGVVQPGNAIDLKDGEHVGGIRVIVKPFTGAIRGQVKIEGGELPPSARLSFGIALLNENSSDSARSYRGEQVDSRGRFHVDGLAAGRYEVMVAVLMPGPQPRYIQSKQEVTVTDNTTSEVVVTVKLKSDPDPDDDP